MNFMGKTWFSWDKTWFSWEKNMIFMGQNMIFMGRKHDVHGKKTWFSWEPWGFNIWRCLLKPVSPHISTHHRFFEVSDLIRSYPDSFESWYNGKHRKIGRLKPPLGYDLMRLEGLVSNLRSVRPQTSQDLLILWEYIYIYMYIIYIQIYIYTYIYIHT